MQFNISKVIEENKNLADTRYIYNKTFKRFEEKTGETWAINNSPLKKIISEPTGFAILNGETDIYSSVISFSTDGSQILSITPTNEHFVFYIDGKEFIKTDVSQVQIADIQGLHYVYFNENGALESKTDFNLQDIMKKYASVATVYWDYINKKAIYIGDKRHAITTDAYQNYLNFINDKTVDYVEGTNIKFTNNIDGSVNDKVDGDGNSNYHSSFAIESGKYKNYDLTNNSEHIEFNENIPIFYKQTISQEKNWVAMAMKTDGTVQVAIANDGEYRIMTSLDSGETWQKIYLPFYSNWTDIIYAQNKFVAIASSGQYSVIISNDGINWSPIIVPQKNKWQSITFGNGVFVVVSLDGINRIMTSTNGTLWISRETPNYLSLKKVKFIPELNDEEAKFIAISEEDIYSLSNSQNDIQAYSKAFVSYDSITWENFNISENKTWESVAYGNGRFLAIASSGRNKLLNTGDINIWGTYEIINVSYDFQSWVSNIYAFGNHMAISNTGENRFIRSNNNGLTWETFNNISNTNSWKKIAANNTNTIAIISQNGTNRIGYSSNNGFTWTFSDAYDNNVLEDIVFGGDKWVLVSSSALNNRIAYSSNNLSSWNDVLDKDGVAWKSISYGNSTFVAVGQKDELWRLTQPPELNNWKSVVYTSSLNLFVAVSSDGTNRVMTSADGITWISRSAAQNNSWQSIIFGNNTLVAVSSDGTNRVMTSTNGTAWVSRSAAENNSWQSVTFGNGTFIAVSSDGTNRVMTSADGATWNAVQAAENNSWQSVTFGNGTFVAVSSDGTNRVMTSADGATWTSRTPTSISNWQSVAYGGFFIVVSYDGLIMVSADGITWFDVDISGLNLSTYNWLNVSYNSVLSEFTVVGQNSKIIKSSDGFVWNIVEAAVSNRWQSTAYGNNAYVTVGTSIPLASNQNDRVMYDLVDNNKIIWSSNGADWNNSTISVNRDWKKIKYLNNGFFIISTTNEIYFSSDGKTDWTEVVIEEAQDQNLQYVDIETSGLVLLFLTNNNKVIVTGIDVKAQNFNANARILNIIDNLSLNDIDVNESGGIVISAKQNKIIYSNNNGSTWQIKDINDVTIDKIKYYNINGNEFFFILSSVSNNKITYSEDFFDNFVSISNSYFNYNIADFHYNNGNYYFLINSGDKRIIKSLEFVGLLESAIQEELQFKNTIKDIYNAWLRYDNLSINETIKNRCIINNNKINYNKFTNNSYSLEICNDNKFYLYHIFMTNDKDDKYFIIAGNNEYDSKEEAKNNIIEEINKLSGLPFNDFLPLGSFIFEVNSQYLNSAKARIVNINGNNYFKLFKKDLVSVNSSNFSTTKKDNNLSLLNNTDLINLYGNKILEYALNKLQNLTSRDIDNFIVRKEITLITNSISNLSTIFGAQITGSYEIFDRNNPEIGFLMFLKQNATVLNPNIEPDISITSFSNLIIPSSSNVSAQDAKLGVYIDNNIVNFKNFSDTPINLVIYRKI